MRPCLSQPPYFAFFEVRLTKVADYHACIFDVVQDCAVGNLPEAVYSTPQQCQACVHVPHDSNSIHHRKISYLTFLCEYHVVTMLTTRDLMHKYTSTVKCSLTVDPQMATDLKVAQTTAAFHAHVQAPYEHRPSLSEDVKLLLYFCRRKACLRHC